MFMLILSLSYLLYYLKVMEYLLYMYCFDTFYVRLFLYLKLHPCGCVIHVWGCTYREWRIIAQVNPLSHSTDPTHWPADKSGLYLCAYLFTSMNMDYPPSEIAMRCFQQTRKTPRDRPFAFIYHRNVLKRKTRAEYNPEKRERKKKTIPMMPISPKTKVQGLLWLNWWSIWSAFRIPKLSINNILCIFMKTVYHSFTLKAKFRSTLLVLKPRQISALSQILVPDPERTSWAASLWMHRACICTSYPQNLI